MLGIINFNSTRQNAARFCKWQDHNGNTQWNGESHCVIFEKALVDVPRKLITARENVLDHNKPMEIVPGGLQSHGSNFVSINDDWRKRVNKQPRIVRRRKQKGTYRGLPGLPG